MEIVGRDAYVESLFRKVREEHGEWGAIIGPHAELLASITTARAVCTAWRSEVDSYLEYHALRLAIVEAELILPPKWISTQDEVVLGYRRNWDTLSVNHVVARAAPDNILNSYVRALTDAELWYLRDILERGRVIEEEAVPAFGAENGTKLWRSPVNTSDGRV